MIKLNYIVHIGLILFYSLTLSLQAAETPTAAAPTASGAVPTEELEQSEGQIRLLALLGELPVDSEAVELKTEQPNEILNGFFSPENTGTPQGGILIFPDQYPQPDEPNSLHHIQNYMADDGWHSLVIYLSPTETIISPNPMNNAASSAVTASGADSTTSIETKTEQVAKLNAHMLRLCKRGIEYLKTQKDSDRFIIIGQGSGAIWAAYCVANYQETEELRLAMINVRNLPQQAEPNILKLLPELETPIIDLYSISIMPSSFRNQPENQTQRYHIARREQLAGYHPSRLPPNCSTARLAKQLRGLIKRAITAPEQAEREAKKLQQQKRVKENPPGRSNR